MRRCKDAVKADFRNRMGPPYRQSVAVNWPDQA
jgi:hypothetical protein